MRHLDRYLNNLSSWCWSSFCSCDMPRSCRRRRRWKL